MVCKTCTRDLYLFKPMMARIAELEARVNELSSRQTLGEQADELVELGTQAINAQRQILPIRLATSAVLFWRHWSCCWLLTP